MTFRQISLPALTVLISLFVLQPISLQAQNEDRFQQTMQKMLEKLEASESPEDYQNAANSFERIGNAESEQWLPWYYAAYSNVMLAYMQTDKTLVDPILDKADKQIARAESGTEENADILVLKSMAASARIQVDFSRGMQYGPAATGLAKQATVLEDGNPRGWLQLGQNLLYTPEQFGGGPAKGCPLLDKAKERYATYEPASSLHPNWGEAYLDEVMKNACSGFKKD